MGVPERSLHVHGAQVPQVSKVAGAFKLSNTTDNVFATISELLSTFEATGSHSSRRSKVHFVLTTLPTWTSTRSLTCSVQL